VAGAPPYIARAFDLSEIEGFAPRTLELHQQIYRAHVDAVNRSLVASTAAGATASATAGNNGSRFAHDYNGMVLHEAFFAGLTGALGAVPAPDGAFLNAASACFGGFEAWKSSIRRLAAEGGNGWVLCMRERGAGRIFNCWIESHAIGLPASTDVIVAVDLWEHAWLPDYGPAQRHEYVDAVLTQLDWDVVERRCRG